ncbi:MAG: hypothetical protein DGJ47_000552 [Rickettsiaceae bacterium]
MNGAKSFMNYSGKWALSELPTFCKNDKLEQDSYKVFSCFHGAGGSSMGYKLAGFNVLGGVEIDPMMMKLYQHNLKPRYSYIMGVEQFNSLPDEDLPKALFDLDILDGSPPCSSFSIAGARSKKWGKKMMFREGQKPQILDDLFFHFINTVKKLRPKIVIAENVKGLITGKARGYVKQILQNMKDIGYKAQLFLIDSADTGVPQRRQRVIFIARQMGLELSDLNLQFTHRHISVKEAFRGVINQEKDLRFLNENSRKLWEKTKAGDSFETTHKNGSRFNEKKLNPNDTATTLTTRSMPMHWQYPRRISTMEAVRLQSFPDDYDFLHTNGLHAIGMSVPPLMMQNIAQKVKLQWLDRQSKVSSP